MWRANFRVPVFQRKWSSVGLRVRQTGHTNVPVSFREYRVFARPEKSTRLSPAFFQPEGRMVVGERRRNFPLDSATGRNCLSSSCSREIAMVHPVCETCLRAHRSAFIVGVVARSQWKFINAPVRTAECGDLPPTGPERPAAFAGKVAVVHENHVHLARIDHHLTPQSSLHESF